MSLYPAVRSAATSVAGWPANLPGRGSSRSGSLACGPRWPPLREGDRTALTAASGERIRTGDLVVFCKPVAVAPAVVRRDGRVQAGGRRLITPGWG